MVLIFTCPRCRKISDKTWHDECFAAQWAEDQILKKVISKKKNKPFVSANSVALQEHQADLEKQNEKFAAAIKKSGQSFQDVALTRRPRGSS